MASKPSLRYERDYASYLTSINKAEITSNFNKHNETSLAVKFKSTDGPTEAGISCYIKTPDSAEFTLLDVASLNLGSSVIFNLPEDGCEFIIYASSAAGKSGNATRTVSLKKDVVSKVT